MASILRTVTRRPSMMHRFLAHKAPAAATTMRGIFVRLSSTLAPFHIAIPVHDLQKARSFYGGVMGFTEGRSSTYWQDYNMLGHQLVVHEVAKDYRAPEFHNPVDADDVPVPHFGVALSIEDFQGLAARMKSKGVKFIIEPHLRFPGRKGEQWTMFFKDPSGNSLEFKAMSNPDYLFAKYVEN